MSESLSFDDSACLAARRRTAFRREPAGVVATYFGNRSQAVAKLPTLAWPRDLFANDANVTDLIDDGIPLPHDMAVVSRVHHWVAAHISH